MFAPGQMGLAPGQMGVAVGLAVSKKTLCIKNFSLEAATLKDPESVS